MSEAALTVYKYPVMPGPFKLQLPHGARILDVQMQAGNPQMWVLLNPDDRRVERTFYTIGTGHTIAGVRYDDLRHRGTFQMADGLVFHVFESWPPPRSRP